MHDYSILSHNFESCPVLHITHLEHPDLADHGLSVDLAHVVARVIPLHVPDVQLPGVDPVMRHGHPGVVGHHVVVDSQDSLAVRSQPCNLE